LDQTILINRLFPGVSLRCSCSIM